MIISSLFEKALRLGGCGCLFIFLEILSNKYLTNTVGRYKKNAGPQVMELRLRNCQSLTLTLLVFLLFFFFF